MRWFRWFGWGAGLSGAPDIRGGTLVCGSHPVPLRFACRCLQLSAWPCPHVAAGIGLSNTPEGHTGETAFLSVAGVAGSLGWHSWRSEPATLPTLAVPIVAAGMLGAVALIARLVGSQDRTMREARLAALGERLRSLPGAEQQALLAERLEVLEVLRGRGVVDGGLAQRAAAARLGDWWLLDKEREAAGNR